MAFLTPLPITPHTSTKATTSTRSRRYHRGGPQPSATIAAPRTPSDPTNPQTAPWMPLPGVVHEVRTPEQYDRLSEVATEDGKLLVIDFMASWCRKCLYLLPKLGKIAGNVPDVYYCTVNVNKVARLPRQFEITKMPTFVFVKDGERVNTIIGGAQPGKVAKDLEAAVHKFA